MHFLRPYSLRSLIILVTGCAIVLAVYRNATYRPDLSGIEGLTVTARRDADTSFAFTDSATRRTIGQVLRHVSNGYPLHFFDKNRRMDLCLGGTATISCVDDEFGLQFRSDKTGTVTCPVRRDEIEMLIWACMAENSTKRSQYWKDRGEGGCQLNSQRWTAGTIGPYHEQWHESIYDYLQKRIEGVDLSRMPP